MFSPETIVSNSTVADNSDYIQGLYPYATHAHLMGYQPQDPIGAVDNVYTQPEKIISNDTVADNSDYIQGLYPYATHAHLMDYKPQSPIGAIEITHTQTVENKQTATTSNINISNDTTENITTTSATTVASDVKYHTAVNVGEIITGQGGNPPLSGSVLYAGSKVSTDITGSSVATSTIKPVNNQSSAGANANVKYHTAVNVGEIITGQGGNPPLAGSVLYAGSKVSTDITGTNTAYNSVNTQTANDTTAIDDNGDTMNYDVVIVGGGPAGLSTAIKMKQLAQQGRTGNIRLCR